MTRLQLVASAAATLALLGGCSAAPRPDARTATSTAASTSTSPRARTEDSPGWDCHRQGNGVCGPIRIDLAGRAVVAVNGRFTFARVVARPQAGWVCVAGPSPLTGRSTLLACGRVS